MIICQGPVKSKNLKKPTDKDINTTNAECLLCSRYIINATSKLTCLNPTCELISHVTCLADLFLTPGEYLPIEGNCPFCATNLKWGDLIRKMKGCSLDYGGDNLADDDNVMEDNYDTEKSDDKSDDNIDDEDMMCSQDRGFVDNNSRWLQDCDDNLL